MASDVTRWIEADGEAFFRDLGMKGDQSILDFGCGAGHYAIPAAKAAGQGGMVYALDKDVSELSQLLKQAQSEGIDNIVPLEISGELAISLEEESVDVVLLFDVLHYMAADERELLYEEVHRVLRNDGRLLVYPKHVKSDQPLWNLRDMDLEGVIEEIEMASFRLEKQSTKRLLHDDDYNEGVVLWFRKQIGS
ncbi:MAG: class I SAM-dependent methyltransferase [Deltaproteobacteria bacterium]|nr:class I SAM-dependent methyltransferase [Deltaproteobacteria bacterium]